MSKKGSIEYDDDALNSIDVLLVFDNLNNLYKRLSVLAIEQQQQQQQQQQPNLVSELVTSGIGCRDCFVDQYKQRRSQWHTTIDVINVDDDVSTWIDIL